MSAEAMMDSLDRLRDALAGRYTVDREIGRGGTATVYVGTDLRHERAVAIKVLRPELTAMAGHARFLREIKITARLTHPNILPVLDSGEADGFVYFVAPFVEGESLRRRLDKEKQLPLDDAILITREVSSALSYAHSKGLVHRDIKPENILLEAGHAVVADFGIAYALDVTGVDRITESGLAVGTPAYMSPEQAEGSSVLDGRSDLYSLGCVLFEMLAGKPPFTGSATAILRKQLLNPDPPDLGEFRPTVPVEVADAVRTALAKAPEDRFATGDQFDHALAGVRDTPSTKPTKVREGRKSALEVIPRHLRRAAAFAVLLIPLAFVPWVRQAVGRLIEPAPLPAPRWVGVLSFKNADSADAALASGLTQSYTQLLVALTPRTGPLWVLPFRDMLDAGAGSPIALRKSYPLDLIVTGEVQNNGGKRSLRTDLIDFRFDPPRIVASLSVPDPSDSLSLASVRALVGQTLALSAPSPSSESSPAVWAASPARRSYLLGAGLMQRAYDLSSLSAAIDNFQTAIDQDARFGPAYVGLCDALWERYLQTGQATLAGDATRMCDKAGELSRTDPAGLVALGRTQYFHGELDRAERTLRDAIRQSAGPEGHRWLGHVLEEQGRFADAERELRKAIALRPELWIYPEALGELYMNIERHQDALELHREVIRLSPDNYIGYSNMGASLMLLNRLDEAEEQLRRSIAVRPSSMAYRNLGYLGILRQKYDVAVVALREAIRYGPEDWVSWRWLAHAYHWRGDRSDERDAWQRVVDLLRSRLDLNPTNQDMLCSMAEALIGLGDTANGLQHLTRLTSHPIIKAYDLYWIGRAYEMAGRRKEAVQYITQALARGFDSHTVAGDPWLRALRADPAYHGPREQR
ncbi:MAG TPA: serine/threonine-protein kinase [Gemmatimonadaceae bacterium]|nr:serine/threonine-protein kinase [Gemmatimonadaceae bacterium]